MTRLIGLYSSTPQSGKSSIANYLHIYNFKTVSFARPIKLMCRVLLSNLGYTPILIDRFMHEKKEEVIPNLGVSLRHLMRTLGTEWGRSCVHPEIWNKCWRISIDRHFRNGHDVVVDDVRFTNEVALLKQVGGEIWRIDRPSAPVQTTTHVSDGGLEDYAFDQTLINEGSLIDLYDQVDRLVSVLIRE